MAFVLDRSVVVKLQAVGDVAADVVDFGAVNDRNSSDPVV